MVKSARIDVHCCFLEKRTPLALAAVAFNSVIGCIMNVRLSALKCCKYNSGHLIAFPKMAKTLKQGVKFAQT